MTYFADFATNRGYAVYVKHATGVVERVYKRVLDKGDAEAVAAHLNATKGNR